MNKNPKIELSVIDDYIRQMKGIWTDDPYPSGLYVTDDRLYVWYVGDPGTTFLCNKEFFTARALELNL